MATTAFRSQVVSFPQEHYNYYNNNYYAEDGLSPKQDNNIARAREEAWHAIDSAYYATFGRTIAPVVRAQMVQMLEQGAAPDLIAAVIEYSAAAPRPSWAYARTVLQRQMDMGTRTAAEFTSACSAYRQKAAQRANSWAGYKPRLLPEQDYEQREYGPELNGPSPEDIAEALKL